MAASSAQNILVHWPAALIGQAAQIAIVARTAPETEPVEADYREATWVGTAGTAGVPVGPGTGLELAPGDYVVWGRVIDGGLRSVWRVGTLMVGPPAP